MTRSLLHSALFCLTAFGAPLALARVEVQPVQHKTLGPMLVAKVSEEISPGDYEVLLRGITGNPGRYVKKIVLLDNIGGSVPEAMRMGRLLRESGFDALVPSTGVCQGTCVYLLAAGRDKTVKGYVGLHKPPFASGDSVFSGLTYQGVRYSPAAYFREMNIPTALLEDMQRIEPRNMRVLSQAELARYRLN